MSEWAIAFMSGSGCSITQDCVHGVLRDHLEEHVTPALLRETLKLWDHTFGLPCLSKWLELEEHARLRLSAAALSN